MAPTNPMKVVNVVQKVVKLKAAPKAKGKKATWKLPPKQLDIPSIANPKEFKVWRGGSLKQKHEEFKRQLGPHTKEEAGAVGLQKWFSEHELLHMWAEYKRVMSQAMFPTYHTRCPRLLGE